MLEPGKRDSTGRTDLSNNKMARRKQNKRAGLVKFYRKLSEDEPRGKRDSKDKRTTTGEELLCRGHISPTEIRRGERKEVA